MKQKKICNRKDFQILQKKEMQLLKGGRWVRIDGILYWIEEVEDEGK